MKRILGIAVICGGVAGCFAWGLSDGTGLVLIIAGVAVFFGAEIGVGGGPDEGFGGDGGD